MARIVGLLDRVSWAAPSFGLSLHIGPPLVACAGLIALVGYTFALAATSPSEPVAWVMAAVFVASVVSGIAGFAFSAVCGALLFHLVEGPMQAVQIVLVCSVGGQALMVWSLRRSIEWRALQPFLGGAAIGLPVGLLLLLQAQPAGYAGVIGLLLVLHATCRLLGRPAVLRHQSSMLDVAAGFLGGITGGAVAVPGAFVSIWCSFKGWRKERQRGLCQPFVLVVQFAAILILTLWRPDGAIGLSFDFSGILYLPAAFIGTLLGLSVFKRLDDQQFCVAVNLLLIVAGLGFLV